MTPPILEVRDIHKSYRAQHALRGVSVEVFSGEILGLLGPNGAGKTTLISILSGLVAADRGSVSLEQKPYGINDRARRNLVGIGTQDLALYPELSARENLHFFGRIYGMNGKSLADRSQKLLDQVGLAERADDRAGTFSGGMKRRLNLAVAVVHEPKLLLLDEPTTGVDPQSRHLIFDMVRSLNAAGMSIVYTSHYMDEVQSLCSRICIIDAGVVKACDSLSNLLTLLPTTITLRAESVPNSLLESLRQLDGITDVHHTGESVTLTVRELGPAMADVATACVRAEFRPREMSVQQPSLERVFLNLTGHALRD